MYDNQSIFVGILIAIAAAVVLQMFILLAMFLTMRKLGARMQAVADKVEDTTGIVQARVLPLLDNAKSIQESVKSFIETSRPKFDTVIDNVTHISTAGRGSVERVNATVNDVVDRVRLQVIRGDEMLTRTMDRVEETSEKVQHTVMSPVRQVSGIFQAISTGVGTYFNSQKRRRNGGPNEEMFI